MLGSFGDDFEIVLEYVWGRVGVVLGSFWAKQSSRGVSRGVHGTFFGRPAERSVKLNLVRVGGVWEI